MVPAECGVSGAAERIGDAHVAESPHTHVDTLSQTTERSTCRSHPKRNNKSLLIVELNARPDELSAGEKKSP